MEKEFLEFVAGVMDVEFNEISMETEYKEFEQWDSMMMITLIMELEEKYNKSIGIERVGSIHTLSDLHELVK